MLASSPIPSPMSTSNGGTSRGSGSHLSFNSGDSGMSMSGSIPSGPNPSNYQNGLSINDSGYGLSVSAPAASTSGTSNPSPFLSIPSSNPSTSASASTSTSTPALLPDPLVDWRYEMRREAQEILPGLFVGPYQSSRSLPDLQKLGITNVVCVFDEREKHLVKPRFVGQFEYLTLEVRDAQDQNLIRLFPAAKAYIDKALSEGGRVLVHCGDGISRSPAIVTAYVMCALNVTHDEAFQYVQNRRFCASPNLNFQRQIEAYESINKASQAMAAYQSSTNGSGSNGVGEQEGARLVQRRKREDEDDDDENGPDEELRLRNLQAQRKRRDPDDSDDDDGDEEMDMS